jgi:hypothetical protein
VLILAAGLFGRTGLGTVLTAAFLLQVTPSVWTAFRAADTTGIAAGTWVLIFGELLCWGAFGVYKSDPRLIVLGATPARRSSRSWPVSSTSAAESRMETGLLAPASGTMFGDCARSQASKMRCTETPRRLATVIAVPGGFPDGPPNGE